MLKKFSVYNKLYKFKLYTPQQYILKPENISPQSTFFLLSFEKDNDIDFNNHVGIITVRETKMNGLSNLPKKALENLAKNELEEQFNNSLKIQKMNWGKLSKYEALEVEYETVDEGNQTENWSKYVFFGSRQFRFDVSAPKMIPEYFENCKKEMEPIYETLEIEE